MLGHSDRAERSPSLLHRTRWRRAVTRVNEHNRCSRQLYCGSHDRPNRSSAREGRRKDVVLGNTPPLLFWTANTVADVVADNPIDVSGEVD